MIDDEIHRDEGVDALGIAAQRHHRVAHGGKVHHGGNAGEVLHQHARRAIGDFLLGLAAVVQPVRDRDDVFLRDGAAILEAQQVLKQHLHGEGERGNARKAILFRQLEVVIDVLFVVYRQGGAALEAVEGGHG